MTVHSFDVDPIAKAALPAIRDLPLDEVRTEGAVQSVSLSAENIFFGRSRPPHGRNTDRDQQARSPGDRFFGFVAGLLNKTVTYPDY